MAPDQRVATIAILLSYCTEYSDAHREFLQLLKLLRYIESSRVGDTFLRLCNAVENNRFKTLTNISPEDNQQVLECLMRTLNAKLITLGLRVVQVSNEFARRMDYIVLISEMHFHPALRNACSQSSDELAMFFRWQRLMFAGHNPIDEAEGNDSAEEELSRPLARGEEKGGGELAVSKALIYAKRKGWTMQRAQKLIDKLRSSGWIVLRSSTETVGEKGVIRLHPIAVAELEPILCTNLHLPSCIICKHPVVVDRLSHKCPSCKSSTHASCILREIEFPCHCPNEGCTEQLEEGLLDEFDWDMDGQHIQPLRNAKRSRTKVTNEAVIELTQIQSTSATSFTSLRDF